MKKLLPLLLMLLLLQQLPLTASAHPGRTDANGGHYNRSTGEYHYHHGYSEHLHDDIDGDGVIDCPYNYKDQTSHEDNRSHSYQSAEQSGTSYSSSSRNNSSTTYQNNSTNQSSRSSSTEKATNREPSPWLKILVWVGLCAFWILPGLNLKLKDIPYWLQVVLGSILGFCCGIGIIVLVFYLLSLVPKQIAVAIMIGGGILLALFNLTH